MAREVATLKRKRKKKDYDFAAMAPDQIMHNYEIQAGSLLCVYKKWKQVVALGKLLGDGKVEQIGPSRDTFDGVVPWATTHGIKKSGVRWQVMVWCQEKGGWIDIRTTKKTVLPYRDWKGHLSIVSKCGKKIEPDNLISPDSAWSFPIECGETKFASPAPWMDPNAKNPDQGPFTSVVDDTRPEDQDESSGEVVMKTWFRGLADIVNRWDIRLEQQLQAKEPLGRDLFI